jgi:hypothetical protein
MEEIAKILPLVFKAIALAMGVASVVLSFLNVAPVETNVTLLGIGLAALAVAVLSQDRE